VSRLPSRGICGPHRLGAFETLHPAAQVALRRHWDGLTAQDPERPGVAWTYRMRDGRFWPECSRSDPNPATDRPESEAGWFVIDYISGSGRHTARPVSMGDVRPTLSKNRA
jgi:hypothetical protein